MGYKPWTDSTLMSLSKKELIEHIRMLEHNLECKETTVERQLKLLQNYVSREDEANDISCD